MELMDSVDSYVPEPDRDTDKPFLMSIEDVFSITGRGTVVTGRVEQGILKVNEEVEIVGIRPTHKTVATGIEMFRKLLDEGRAGDNVGVLLRGVGKDEVERGQVLAKPGSITPHTDFEAQVYVLTKEEGGRHNPFFPGYRPQFYFRTTDVTGSIQLPEGTQRAGDNVGVLLRGVGKDEVERGQVLAKPGSITPHTDFEAQVYVLTKEEGGRHNPFFPGYRPQFYFRTTDVTGSIQLPEGTQMVMPGDNTEMNVELIAPIAMDEGLRFAIREGGRTVGAGRVIKILK